MENVDYLIVINDSLYFFIPLLCSILIAKTIHITAIDIYNWPTFSVLTTIKFKETVGSVLGILRLLCQKELTKFIKNLTTGDPILKVLSTLFRVAKIYGLWLFVLAFEI